MSSPDLLIVLGKNIGVGSAIEDIRQDPDHLSDESRMSVSAAGMLYMAREEGVDLLFSGGHTAGADIASEGGAMKARFMREYPGIPESRLYTEEESIDSRTNAIEIAKLLPAMPDYDRIDLMSVFYHVNNAATLLRRFHIPIDGTHASDEVIRARSEQDEAFVQDWFGSDRIRQEVQKERIRSVLLSTIDRRGRLLHAVTQRSRG